MINDKIKSKVIGINVDTTTTTIAVVDLRGNIVAQDSIPTQNFPNVNNFVEALSERVVMLAENNGGYENIRSVGMCAPSANYLTGCIENAANMPWKGVIPIAAMLRDSIGLAVALGNDAHVTALGERAYGVAHGMDNFIVVTLVGSGLGSCVFSNGLAHLGCDGFAGELGHVIVEKNGRPCGCGRKGCLEAYCSATGVARTARELLATTDRPSLLRDMKPEDITSLDVSIAAGKGDELANEIYEFTGHMLGEACANFAAFSSPEAFIFFGGMTKAGELIMKPIRESYEENVLKIFKGKAKFLVSVLDGSSAAVLGASAVGWEI
jgi:glucokinase